MNKEEDLKEFIEFIRPRLESFDSPGINGEMDQVRSGGFQSHKNWIVDNFIQSKYENSRYIVNTIGSLLLDIWHIKQKCEDSEDPEKEFSQTICQVTAKGEHMEKILMYSLIGFEGICQKIVKDYDEEQKFNESF
jgi:hypothetical protein